MTREEASKRVFDAFREMGFDVETIDEDTRMHDLRLALGRGGAISRIRMQKNQEFCSRVAKGIKVPDLFLNMSEETTVRDIIECTARECE